MKIKPVYLYGGIALLCIVFLIFFSPNNDNDFSQNETMNKMPDDDVHKGLKDPMQSPPGKDNVTGNVRNQLEELKNEVEKNSDDTLKIREYADLLAAAHRQEEAVIYYYKILNVNPRRIDILNSLAFIYYNKNDFKKAAGLIEKVLLYEPENTEAIYNLGVIAASSGDKVKAKERWEELINKYPKSDEARLAENSLKKL